MGLRCLVVWLSLILICVTVLFTSSPEAQGKIAPNDSTHLITPLSFTSEVAVEAVVDSTRVPLNRNLTLTIKIICTGDVNQFEFQWPNPPDLDRLDIVGSSSANIVRDEAGHLVTVKEFRYILKPVGEGHGRIGPVTLSYTDKLSQRDYSLSTRVISVEITESLIDDGGGTKVIVLPLFGLLVIISIFGILFYSKKRRSSQEEATSIIDTVSPEKIALEELGKVPELRLAGELKEYYAAISSVFRRYIDRTYSLRTLELTTHDIIHNLKLHGVAEDTTKEIEKILNMCDMVKFAPQEPAASDLDTILSRAQDFFESRIQISSKDVTEEGREGTEPQS